MSAADRILDNLRRHLGPTTEQYEAASPGADGPALAMLRPSPTPRPRPAMECEPGNDVPTGTLPTSNWADGHTARFTAPGPTTFSSTMDAAELPREITSPAVVVLDGIADAALADPGPVPAARHLDGCDGYPSCLGCAATVCPRCRFDYAVPLLPLTICEACEEQVGVQPRCCTAWPLAHTDTCEGEPATRDLEIVQRAERWGDEITAGHPALSFVVRVLLAHDLVGHACRCGWGGNDQAQLMFHPEHVAHMLAVAGQLRAPLALRDPDSITWAEIDQHAALTRAADLDIADQPAWEGGEEAIARAYRDASQIVMRSGRVYVLPAPPETGR